LADAFSRLLGGTYTGSSTLITSSDDNRQWLIRFVNQPLLFLRQTNRFTKATNMRLFSPQRTLLTFLGGLLMTIAPLSVLAAECPALLNHQFKTLQGESIDLCQYRDKPILVVNTASKCGFTPQFEKLEGLYSRYKAKGLLVIGFPSNDFRQEFKSDAEIGSFCKLTYGVKFPMVSKGAVTGAQANPFYKQLAAATGQEPQWNFHKYVIMPGGKTVHSFMSVTAPDDPAVMKLIEPNLK
jgi:glutathione peroxidase